MRTNVWIAIPLFGALMPLGVVNGNLYWHFTHQTAEETIEFNLVISNSWWQDVWRDNSILENMSSWHLLPIHVWPISQHPSYRYGFREPGFNVKLFLFETGVWQMSLYVVWEILTSVLITSGRSIPDLQKLPSSGCYKCLLVSWIHISWFVCNVQKVFKIEH